MFDAGTGLRGQQVRLLDGRTIRTVVAGSGDPLVVFEGGIAVCASIWMTVRGSPAKKKAIEMTELFDLVVIGSGPAGEKGAGPGRLLRQEGSDR